ncbi:MAG: cupin domain-containing protein [Nitrospirae bacterium]|nr:MAG: cupin domain-containing protein [Nitrospirota bacterium]
MILRKASDMKRTWCGALIALLWLGGCAAVPSPGAPDFSRPEIADLQAQLERDPIRPGETVRITRLVESPDMSGLLVQIQGAMPPHFHKRTQEVIYLLRGEGMLQLGTERMPIKAGAVVRVPAGRMHTFTSQGPAPAVFFVVTTPRWDEQDRVMAPE